ncbi:hypothetical protein BC834DRAFT_974534 [Gloeopeniophorella convolvens]|nr:hypothetical protein BC834DRAFT_974534 [Gloeopeniophorella convolvens]
MVHYLLRSRGDVQRTNSALKLLAFYSINCGILSIVCIAITTAFIAILPQTLIWVIFFNCQTALYFCSFMSMYVLSRH